jgi:hypothetical protein
VADKEPKWPEGLSDLEAIERLESLLLLACEGNKDLSNGREYKALRSALLRRSDLADAVPRFVRSQRDLAAFWAYIKAKDGQWEPRRRHVRESFQSLYDRLEGRTKPPIRASNWTGRRSKAEQVRVVLSLAPDALAAAEALLEDQTRGLHNGGPIDPERLDAIESLKALRDELSELIRLAEHDLPIEEKLRRIREVKARAFRWMASPIGFGISNLPLTGSSLVLGVGLMHVINAISPGDGATMGAGAMAAHIGSVALARNNKKAR